MSDWRQVDSPAYYPNECIGCGRKAGVVGPVIDTRRELPLHPKGFRIYLCKQCVYLGAVTLELVDSKDADERMDFRERIEGLEQEIKDRDQISYNLSEEAENALVEKVAAEEEGERLRVRLAQAQDMLQKIGQDAKSTLEATVETVPSG